jgi:hypothetical protein
MFRNTRVLALVFLAAGSLLGYARRWGTSTRASRRLRPEMSRGEAAHGAASYFVARPK